MSWYKGHSNIYALVSTYFHAIPSIEVIESQKSLMEREVNDAMHYFFPDYHQKIESFFSLDMSRIITCVPIAGTGKNSDELSDMIGRYISKNFIRLKN